MRMEKTFSFIFMAAASTLAFYSGPVIVERRLELFSGGEKSFNGGWVGT